MKINKIIHEYSLIGLVAVAACASFLPLPGGDVTVNETYYETRGDLLERVDKISVGMAEDKVFEIMNHPKNDFQQLTREEILTALTGSNSAEIHDGTPTEFYDQSLIKSLYGYRLEYKTVNKKLGFSSPIRIKTNEKGYDYFVTFIFRDNALFEEPIVSGGVVNASSSKTFFDYLNPGSVMDRLE